MLRILIVEDDENVLTQLGSLLRAAFPAVQVEIADTTEHGLALVQQSKETKRPYDVIILDFHLPRHTGEVAETDTSICHEASVGPYPFIIHVSAHENDVKIQQHLSLKHLEEVHDKSIFISKNKVSAGQAWTDQLLSKLRSYLYGGQILMQIDDIFGGTNAAPSYRLRPSRSASMRGSLTHDLAALCSDIETYWRDLDDHTRDKVLDYFEVNDAQSAVHVCLK